MARFKKDLFLMTRKQSDRSFAGTHSTFSKATRDGAKNHDDGTRNEVLTRGRSMLLGVPPKKEIQRQYGAVHRSYGHFFDRGPKRKMLR